MSVRHALLGLLVQRPRHGYDLHAAFEAVLGGEQNWDVKPGQIYTTLARLEEKGLIQPEAIEQDAGPEKRIYVTTPAGQKAFAQWLVEGIQPEHQRDEFFIKLMLALATGAAHPHKVIQAQRAQLYQDLHAITLQRQGANPKTELARILLIEKTVKHLEADLSWLDLIEARLDEVKRQPLPEPETKARGRPRKTAAADG